MSELEEVCLRVLETSVKMESDICVIILSFLFFNKKCHNTRKRNYKKTLFLTHSLEEEKL